MNYAEWAQRWPGAALELQHMLTFDTKVPENGKKEAWSQQRARFNVSKQGAYAWRNNVGATPAKCKHCGAKQQPIRYGLANDSAKLNEGVKSSDLILAIPRLITHEMVGQTIAQFGSVEVKRPGWEFKGTAEEIGQAAWLALISSIGGYAVFSTGEVRL